jgi:isocitrate/isopropylmalate dehydrogenase
MKIVVFPGDDIGPEITVAAVRVLEHLNETRGLGLGFETHDVGYASHCAEGTYLPETAIEAALAADGVIFGPVGISEYPETDGGSTNISAMVRKRLDLFANIRPARSRPGIPRALPGLDLVMVRENTEGFYADRNMFAGIGEFMPTEDVALSVRKITAEGSRRIARTAFDLAERRRRKVTAVHKRVVLRLTDGLFLRQVRAEAEKHPDVEFDTINVDSLAAALYEDPGRFDVILITNMFGDILSNLSAALSGSLGQAASVNAGHDHATANAGHGSAPDIAGMDRANPTGMIVSSAMLLDWLATRHDRADLREAAQAIEGAVDRVLAEQRNHTSDLGGSAGTRAFTEAVIGQLA